MALRANRQAVEPADTPDLGFRNHRFRSVATTQVITCLTNLHKILNKSPDYVPRRCSASSAELKKPEGAGPSLEPPLNAISRANWNLELQPTRVAHLEEVSH